MVRISENFPDLMLLHQKTQILALIENSSSTATKVFRQLVKLIVPDEKIWAENNHASMIIKYPVFNACIGKKQFFKLNV